MAARYWMLLACLLAHLGAAHAADAAAADPRTRWGCQVAEQHLVCFVEQAAATPAAAADSRLPPAVRELRQHPAAWRGRTVRIPLFNEPFDDSPVQQLAQAVLCGAARDCEAVLGRERWATMTAWLDFADANDPLLQRGE